jgi:signal transduction histidine kinase
MPESAKRWLATTGLVTWLVVGLPGWFGLFDASTIPLANVAHLGFGVAFVAANLRRDARRLSIIALGAQSVLALATCAAGGLTLAPALLVIVAGQAPAILARVPAFTLVGIQSLALIALAWSQPATGGSLLGTGSFIAFELFALAASHLASREAEARRALEVANTELAVAHASEAETQRIAARLQLSRELHDRVGHHLTALSLELELALHAPDDPARASVGRARALASELLVEVRAVVSEIREQSAFDLPAALRTLATTVASPKLHVAFPEDVQLADWKVAHALFRCAQEAVTNAVRHAAAANVWIALERDTERWTLTARDDGVGRNETDVVPQRSGNGLVGLRERIADLGGALEIESTPGHGFVLRVSVPGAVAP